MTSSSLNPSPLKRLYKTLNPIFDGENFEHGSIQMQTLFVSQDLWEFVEYGYEIPTNKEELNTWSETKQKEYKENKKKDAKALVLIHQSVTKSIFSRIMGATKSMEAWNILKMEFQGSEKMEGRKWEDLDMDCLVNVFGSVGMESMLLDVPLVCKSWYKVTLNPQCWKTLIFPKMNFHYPFNSRLVVDWNEYWDGDEKEVAYFDKIAFIKSVIKRSHGCAVTVQLPVCTTKEVLTFVADECPALKTLLLPYDLSTDVVSEIPSLINKWKQLEGLRLPSSYLMQEILIEVGIHCKNFAALCVIIADIGHDETASIIASVPSIKYLYLRHANLERENLVFILQECRELVYLDVRDCTGFDEDDDEILMKLTSHIDKFLCGGSRINNWEDEDFSCSYRVDGFHDGNISD